MNKKTHEIRQMFLNFFNEKQHKIIPGSSLIPHNDSSLLFTNAGMNQFKDIFLGVKKNYQYTKVVTSQYCLRAGGKHNDLEQVGYSPHHHTFFEMLGNFSFGKYFKKQAILYAWELLTSKKWFALPKDRFLITVHSQDHETYEIWSKNIGISSQKIIRIGNQKNYSYNDSDNFWQMGDTGPCGPCTEIFYDYGENINTPISKKYYNLNQNNRYLEVWNIVFIQFNRIEDGSLIDLPKKSVDTGMGLERIAKIMQNVSSNYEIDIFRNLIKKIAKINAISDLKNQSLYVIADHIRACYFMISDDVFPSNEGRGYVLRRIIRRASRHGYKLGIKTIFLYKLVSSLMQVMNINDIKKIKKQKNIENILKKEEIQFNHTLENGLKLLHSEIKKTVNNVLDGDVIFYLYDTFGFPIDLTIDVCREYNIEIDLTGFNKAMEKQKKQSKKVKNINKNNILNHHIDIMSVFKGYTVNKTLSTLSYILINDKIQKTISIGEKGVLLLNETPFYGESGGQIGDTGIIYNHQGKFQVENTKKQGSTIFHIGFLISGKLHVSDLVTSEIDYNRRKSIQKNHSAIHLLHSALIKTLGEHIYQRGSFIDENLIRFDFFHTETISLNALQSIERLVNSYISNNIPITTDSMLLKDINKKNVLSLPNKQYPSIVRVVSIGNYSHELCGGTHTKRTGDIGLFKILYERSIASNIHRIEASTGKIALEKIHIQDKTIKELSLQLKTNNQNLKNAVQKIISNNIIMEKEISILKEKEILQEVQMLIKKTIKIKNLNLLIATLYNKNIKSLRLMIDQLKNKLKHVIIVLANIIDKKVIIIVGVTKHATQIIKANNLIQMILKNINGKGGGKSDIAEGGSVYLQKLPETLSNIKLWITAIV